MDDLDVETLSAETSTRWLRPEEIYAILGNSNLFVIDEQPLQKPQSGAMALFDRKIVNHFRTDGHKWKKPYDRLIKIRGEHRLRVYYSRSEEDTYFVRRCYNLLTGSLKDLVLVHYRQELKKVNCKRKLSSISASKQLEPGNMVKAIRIHDFGGPEVLSWEDVEVKEPGANEIRLRNRAVGVNFIDTFFRKGGQKIATPFTPGVEAVGEVVAVGPGVTDTKVGDIVGYAGIPVGAYAEEQILPAHRAVDVPASVDPIIAAASMAKGMTAQFLIRRCFKVEPGHTVLVHAAAGGVGSFLCQWLNALGATVIGTVSTMEKAAQAKEDGCHHVILYKDENFVIRVNEITSGKGVDVVYDSVGKDTFEGSLACLKTRGYMVSFGQASGAPDPIPLSALAPKCLFLTRPSLYQYTETREELLESARDVFDNIASGVLRVRVNHTYPLSSAAQAHDDLENRRTSGSVVLIP